jgi:hypothetical protein
MTELHINTMDLFEPDDTNDYIKSKVNLCTNELFSRISQNAEDFNKQKEVIEKLVKSNISKMDYLENNFSLYQIELDKLCKKVIQDITEQKQTHSEQKEINTKFKKSDLNSKKDISELKIFKERCNDIITSLQSRLDTLESKKNDKNDYLKKINLLENKINSQNSKIKTLESTFNEELIQKITSKVISELEKSNNLLDLKMMNIIKTNETRNKEYNTKLNHVISELNILQKKGNEDVISVNNNELMTKLSTDIAKHNEKNNKCISNLKDLINKELKEKTDTFNQLKERISNLEQQIICQMTLIHNVSMSYNYSQVYIESD